jgi:hypothetical protein
MSLTYTRDIPDPPSSPSVDVPNMKVNTNSIDTIWTRDHFTFESANAGLHNRVQLVQISTNLPVGLRPIGSGTLFTKVVGTSPQGELFFYRIGALDAIQMTGPSSPLAATDGRTFLPGGILIQWGRLPGPVQGDNPISFSTSFPTATFSIQISLVRNAANVDGVVIKSGSITNSGFIAIAPTPGSTAIHWMAIGN